MNRLAPMLNDFEDLCSRIEWRGDRMVAVHLRECAFATALEVLSHPTAAELEVLQLEWPSEAAPLPVLFAQIPRLPLRVLALGGVKMGGVLQRDLGSIDGIEAHLERLDELHVIGPDTRIPALDRVRVLNVQAGLSPAALRHLAAQHFPSLGRLEFGVPPGRTDLTGVFAQLLRRVLPAAPALRELVLRGPRAAALAAALGTIEGTAVRTDAGYVRTEFYQA